ncbi:MAG: hypothetical protein ACREO5_04820 [Candidatus Binatia bacterium]
MAGNRPRVGIVAAAGGSADDETNSFVFIKSVLRRDRGATQASQIAMMIDNFDSLNIIPLLL